jgi:hypothetical protein
MFMEEYIEGKQTYEQLATNTHVQQKQFSGK